METKYIGGRTADGGVRVLKICGNTATELNAEESLRIRKHSPDGFNWGYGGSGPSQMALAIILDHTGNQETAQQIYQEFKRDVVSRMPDSWTLTADEIERWLSDHKDGREYFNLKWGKATT